MKSESLFKNIISSLILQIVSLIYGFIVPILIIKFYGSETNGLISSITKFLSYIVLLEVGIGPVVKNALFKPLVEKDKNKVESILGTANRFFKFIAKAFIIYVLILCVIYPFIVQEKYSQWYVISLILAISISRLSEYFIGMTYKLFLQSDGKNYIIDFIYIITYIIDIIAIYILIKASCSIQFIKLICSLIYLIRPLCMKIYFEKKYNFSIDKKSTYVLDKKWDALFHHIAATVQDNTDIIVLTLFSTLTNVSIYSIYSLVITGIQSIIYSFINGLDAFFGKMMVKENNDVVRKKFENYNFLYYTISTILLACTIVLVIPFVEIYTANISDANYSYPLFAYVMVFAEFNFIIRYPYSTITFAKGHFKETCWFSILEPIVNITLSIIFVKKYGLIGVAIGTFISILIRSFGFIIYASKNILKMNLIKNFKIIILSYIELIIVLLIKIKFINITINNYFSWFIFAVCNFIVITIFICLTNSLFYKDKVKNIINFLKNRRKSVICEK